MIDEGIVYMLTARVLQSVRFHFMNEAELQAGVAKVLEEHGVVFEREHRLGPKDRVDFWIGHGIALEVKVDGSLSAVTRQLHRYAQSPDVHAIILVTSKRLHDRMPTEMNSKPVEAIVIRGSAL